MDKVSDITKILEKKAVEKNLKSSETSAAKTQNVNKATNPILKKLACFKNDNLSKKFDINDLI